MPQCLKDRRPQACGVWNKTIFLYISLDGLDNKTLMATWEKDKLVTSVVSSTCPLVSVTDKTYCCMCYERRGHDSILLVYVRRCFVGMWYMQRRFWSSEHFTVLMTEYVHRATPPGHVDGRDRGMAGTSTVTPESLQIATKACSPGPRWCPGWCGGRV